MPLRLQITTEDHWDKWRCSWPLDSELTFMSGLNPLWNGHFSPSSQWNPFLTQKEVSRTLYSELLHSRINIVFLLYQHINELNQSEVNWCLKHSERVLKPGVLHWKLHLKHRWKHTTSNHTAMKTEDRRRHTREGGGAVVFDVSHRLLRAKLFGL